MRQPLSEKDAEEGGGGGGGGGGEQTSLTHSSCGSEPFSYVVVIVDGPGCLVVDAFYGSDQVGIDFIQRHGCPQSCMPYSNAFLKSTKTW